MKGNNILSSLCYFSIFCTILLPIIVYFVAEDEVKYHAKKAFWSHVFPYAILFGGLAVSGMYGLGFNQSDGAGIGMAITYAVFILVGIYYFIWNIVKGIKVLKTA